MRKFFRILSLVLEIILFTIAACRIIAGVGTPWDYSNLMWIFNIIHRIFRKRVFGDDVDD